MHDESGGVEYTAKGIAGYYEALWKKLSGRRASPHVAAVHPDLGERGAPSLAQPPRTAPGPNVGGAANRIVAVLSNAVDPASVTPQSFRLLDERGRSVPALEGTPRAGPYHTEDGTHSVLWHPAADLEPCTRYTAELTRGVRDLSGNRLADRTTWAFRTRAPKGIVAPARAGATAARSTATIATRAAIV